MRRTRCIPILLLSALLACPSTARADAADNARAHYDHAVSLYALGKYDEAAQEYEQAFALKADSALLYNAAQAHRRAGNKARALTLYENYLAVFGSQISNRKEVQRKIDELRTALDAEQRAKNSAPAEPAPMRNEAPPAAAPATRAPASAPALPATQSAPVVISPPAPVSSNAIVATPPAPEHVRYPVRRRAWIWGVVAGGVAAAALGIGLGIGLGSSTVAPAPSFGTVKVTPQ